MIARKVWNSWGITAMTQLSHACRGEKKTKVMWNSPIVSPCYPVRMNNIINIPLTIPLIIHEPHIVGYIPCCPIISYSLSSNFPNTWICSRCLFSLKKIFSVGISGGLTTGRKKKPSSAIEGQRKSRGTMILNEQLLGFRVLTLWWTNIAMENHHV